MEPWYRVVLPRQELREGRSLDPSEFAVHLEQVAAGKAPRDYVEPAKFFARNYFAKALKLGIAQPSATPPLEPPVPPRTQPPLPPGTPPVTPPAAPGSPKPTVVVRAGELKREQWNLFSLRVLTGPAEAENVEIKVKAQATLKEGQTAEPLNRALKELGISETFKKPNS